MKFLLPLLLAALSMASAKSLFIATEYFGDGNAAYEKGDFETAAAAYQKAEDLGIAADSRLYFNHGNALFRLNRLGPAILHYERARKLAPLDEDIASNLRFAQSRVVDKIPEPEINLLTKLLTFLHNSYSLRMGIWFAFTLFSLVFLFAALAMLSGKFLRGFSILGLVCSLLALLAFSPFLYYKIRQQETENFGIVLEQSVEMLSGPGENYQVLAKVHEGTKFEIVEQRGEWLSVKLSNGKGGYVRANRLGKV